MNPIASNAATALIADRTAVLGSSVAAVAGIPWAIIACYITARLLLPFFLIIYATHGAAATHRIALIRDYLLSQSATPRCHTHPLASPKPRKRRTTR